MKKILLAIILLGVTFFSGCSQEQNWPLQLTMKSDKDVYQPGESVWIEGFVKNNSDKSVTIEPFDGKSGKRCSWLFIRNIEKNEKVMIQLNQRYLDEGEHVNYQEDGITVSGVNTRFDPYDPYGKSLIKSGVKWGSEREFTFSNQNVVILPNENMKVFKVRLNDFFVMPLSEREERVGLRLMKNLYEPSLLIKIKRWGRLVAYRIKYFFVKPLRDSSDTIGEYFSFIYPFIYFMEKGNCTLQWKLVQLNSSIEAVSNTITIKVEEKQ